MRIKNVLNIKRNLFYSVSNSIYLTIDTIDQIFGKNMKLLNKKCLYKIVQLIHTHTGKKANFCQ